jgi:hypothetical protein
LVELDGDKRHGCHPRFDGVVVSARSATKSLGAIKERQQRVQSPAALARKEKARQAKIEQDKARRERCDSLGIAPDGRTVKWLD